jgi:hypothetical protein
LKTFYNFFLPHPFQFNISSHSPTQHRNLTERASLNKLRTHLGFVVD